jgi:hypothetical protein
VDSPDIHMHAISREKLQTSRMAAPDGLGQAALVPSSSWGIADLADACWRFGIAGCIDGRTVRKGGDRHSVSEPARAAIYAVCQETRRWPGITAGTQGCYLPLRGRLDAYAGQIAVRIGNSPRDDPINTRRSYNPAKLRPP